MFLPKWSSGGIHANWKVLKGRVWHLLNYWKHRIKKYRYSYPVVFGYSDIVCIPKGKLDDFCRILEVFSAWNMFVELAIPTALQLLPGTKLATLEDTQYKSGNVWFPQDPEHFEAMNAVIDGLVSSSGGDLGQAACLLSGGIPVSPSREIVPLRQIVASINWSFYPMMKYAVIGAGVSGLSMAGMLLKKGHEVVVYERGSRPGGLIKCTEVQGNLYHRVGGHVFNSRRQEVLDWFWSRFDRERDFVSARRRAVISLEGGDVVDYPIENHLDQFPEAVRSSIVHELLELYRNPPAEPPLPG